MKGLSIRVPPVPDVHRNFKALGARGVTLQFSEVYSGMQQKSSTPPRLRCRRSTG
jgi:TRAP-type C4-dicarboxylate transport system substrate-binding protein